MSVDEYTREFEKLLIKCDIEEPEEQTIVWYLRGLEPKYSNIVELQQYTTFDKVCILAHKVQQQKKKQPVRREFPKPQNCNSPFNKGSSNQPQRTPATNTPYPQRTQAPQKAFTPPNRPNPIPMSTRRCFKCQGLGHIASDCPNRKVITLAEWESVKEEEKDEEEEEAVAEEEENPEEEVTGADEGEMLVLRRALSTQRSEKDKQRENIFHSQCTVQGKVCSLIIDGGSCANVVSLSMIRS